MKVNKLPGEFGFKALFPPLLDSEINLPHEFVLSVGYYFTLEDAQAMGGKYTKWPCEVWEDGSIYCPTLEELE